MFPLPENEFNWEVEQWSLSCDEGLSIDDSDKLLLSKLLKEYEVPEEEIKQEDDGPGVMKFKDGRSSD
jgi:hypothetical protein